MLFLKTIKSEFLSIFKNAGMMIILFIGPVFLTLFFGGVYYNDSVKDIPIAVLDEDQSNTSTLIADYFLTNERFDITNYPSSRAELQELIDSGTVQMGIYIPPDFESKVSTFQASQILALLDGTNTVVSNNAYAQATSIVQSISAAIGMKLIQGKGVLPEAAQNIALIYNIQERMLFDSKMTYMNYLMVCFLAVFIQQLMMAAMGSMLIRHKDFISNGQTTMKAIASTAACYIGILPTGILSAILLVKLFHVKWAGNVFTLMLMTTLFIFALIGPALTFAAFAKDRVKYGQFSFMLSLPTFVTSGCVWPVEQMPTGLQYLIKAFWPLINYAKPVQEIFVKGMDFQSVLPNMVGLLFFGLIWLPIGVRLYKRAFTDQPDKIVEVNPLNTSI